ncbi:hypothetical protein [Bosea sp. ASV33]|uniref:hypothetical protein n=1 Tax=Bosea sp. ASV33 TaxID=2795106 RepID=UPI0018EB39A2|nr:hypothetical protein [Bosea sp. ASV33]
MTQESEAPIKLPQASVVKALFAEANRVKEQTSSIAGQFGDRIKTQVEVGNLCGPAFRQAASIFKKARNNELKAKEHLYHLRAYLDWVEEDLVNKGHVGNLADMAEDGGEEPEVPQETAAEAADRIFTEQNRAAAGEALDLDNLKTEAPTEPAKPKGKGGRKKAVEAQTEEAPPAPVDDDVPAAPSSEDFSDDIRPAFLRARDEERAVEEQGGTFSRVH